MKKYTLRKRSQNQKHKHKQVMMMMEEDDDQNQKNIISKMKGCGGGCLVSYSELPEYMKDNEYILNYYRAEWSVTQAFFSLFRWHNETLNVWTHFLGFIVFVVLTIGNAKIHVHHQVPDPMTIFTRHFSTITDANVSHNFNHFFLGQFIETSMQLGEDMTSLGMQDATTWPFFVFLSGSMFCLLSSTACHLFCCHSHNLNSKLLNMDYVGITVMIITSFFPPIYYIFQCSPHWQIIYLGGITLMGICTIITLLSPAFSSGKYRSFRASLFISMGLFGLIPAIHGLAVNWSDPHRGIILKYETIMALSYLIGAMFYICRIPERWLPGWFDLAGHSHQIFHVFVMSGALAHYGAARVFLQYRSTLGCEMH